MAVALAAKPDLPFGPDRRTALAKVLRAMDKIQRARPEDLATRIWLRMSPARGRSPAARIVDEALRAGVVVNLDYEDADGQVTISRRVEPLAFARTEGQWYLLGWCHRTGAGRWLRPPDPRRPAHGQAIRLQRPPRDLRRATTGRSPRGDAPLRVRVAGVPPGTGTARS